MERMVWLHRLDAKESLSAKGCPVGAQREEELEVLFQVFDYDGNLELDLGEFQTLSFAVIATEQHVTHFNAIDEIPDAQAWEMCNWDWVRLQKLDDSATKLDDCDEASGLERELKRRLKRKYRHRNFNNWSRTSRVLLRLQSPRSRSPDRRTSLAASSDRAPGSSGGSPPPVPVSGGSTTAGAEAAAAAAGEAA
eukprot:2691946-Rhodomonas_salina.1